MPHASVSATDRAGDFDRLDDQLLTTLMYRTHEVAFLVDETGVVRFVPAVAKTPLGYPPSVTVGRSVFDFVHDDDKTKARALLAATLVSPEPPAPMQLRALASDGSWKVIEVALTNLLGNPVIGRLLVNLRDVSEQAALERALRASEARYRSIVETAREGIWLLDGSGRTLFANRTLAEILGLELSDIAGISALDVIAPEARGYARERLRSRRRVGHEVYELPFTRGDGDLRMASVSASPLYVQGEYIGSLAMISDITERKRAETALQRRALYDELTGLPNRTLLRDRLEQALDRAATPANVAVLFIDIDHFNAVNGSYGHDAGDEVLRQIADRLRAVVRQGDTLARIAGDEFVMVCSDVTDEGQARALADRVMDAFAAPVRVADTWVNVSASVGVSLGPASDDGMQQVHSAEAAMLGAKQRGRGRHMMFDASTAPQAHYHLEDVRELRSALDRGELTVYFQPQIDLTHGGICSVEALVRWRHPVRGLLEPSEFIALAETSGLITRLGEFVLKRACRQAAHWARELDVPIPVAVNVSARQLDDEQLPGAVREALAQAKLPPQLLGLEITETAVMSDPERAVRALTELHDDGVRVAIDDFGTGYSSLSHLTRLPVDEIKIDREFVDGIAQDTHDRSIVNAVVSMAQALKLRVVGEGVETTAQANALRSMGCDVVQGFLYGTPTTAQDITDTVNAMARRETGGLTAPARTGGRPRTVARERHEP